MPEIVQKNKRSFSFLLIGLLLAAVFLFSPDSVLAWNINWYDWNGSWYGNWRAQTYEWGDTFDANWGNGRVGPWWLYKNDNIGFIAEQWIYFSAGNYNFVIGSDDGSWLYMDGSRIIDNWGYHGYQERWSGWRWVDGWKRMQIYFFEGGGDARMRFSWNRYSDPCPNSPPSYPSWTWDRVWCNRAFSEKLGDGPDYGSEKIDQNWGGGSVEGIRSDDIGFRSGRNVYFSAGSYRFVAGSDDGIKVWIDGNYRGNLSYWGDRGFWTKTEDVWLNEGWHQLRVDYYENGYGAQVYLNWERICSSHASYTCSDGNIYWYNSCGGREEMKESCGYTSGWYDNYRCSGNIKQRQWWYRSGCSGSSCNYYTDNWSDSENCGGDYWADSYTCSGNTRQRWYVHRGCSGGNCYNWGSWENIQNCGETYSQWRCSGNWRQYRNIIRCSGGNCGDFAATDWINSQDCGGSGWTDNYQCSGSTRQRQYRYQGCSGSGNCYGPTYEWQNWEYNSPSCDSTPPSFSYFNVSPTGWTNGNPTWSWSATDSGSGLRSTNPYYIFLDGAGQGFTNSTSYQPSLGTGVHRVSVNAYDNAGNVRGSGDVWGYVDKTKPNTPNIDSPNCPFGICPTQSGNFTVSVSNDGDNAGGSGLASCYYHIYDSAAGWTKSWASRTCNSSFTVTVGSGQDCRTNNGTCSVYVAAKDNAANEGDNRIINVPIKWSNPSRIDCYLGNCIFDKTSLWLGDKLWACGSLKTSGGSPISGRNLELRNIDGAAANWIMNLGQTDGNGTACKEWTPSASYTGTRSYRVYFPGDSDWQTSWGNLTTLVVNVDNTPPTFTTALNVTPTGWTNTNPIWRWQAADAGVGMHATQPYYIFLDGGGQGYSTATSYQPSLSSGSHRVSVNAYDKSNNVVGSGDVWAYVDKIKPNTPNITSPASNSTQGSDFTVSVSNDGDNANGSGLASCYYFVYDSGAGWTRQWVTRACNSSFTVTVGTGKDCRTNNGTCSVYVAAKDNAANEGDSRIINVSIKWVEESKITDFTFQPNSLTLGQQTIIRGWLRKSDNSGIGGKRIYLMELVGSQLNYVLDANNNAIFGVTETQSPNVGYVSFNWSPTPSYFGTRNYRLYFVGDSEYLGSQTLSSVGLTVNIPSLNYPTDKWQRIWYDYAGQMLGEGPHESNIQFNNDWGNSTLAYGFSNDVQFNSSRTIYLGQAGVYRFTLGYDDGAKLWIDGTQYINDWNNGGYRTASAEVNLSQGNHRVRIDYYENGGAFGLGSARLSFGYQLACTGNISLALDREVALANSTFNGTVSGLSGSCSGFNVEVGTIVAADNTFVKHGECEIGAAGTCQATVSTPTFAVVYWKMSYAYWARIDKNRDGDFTDAGEESLKKNLTIIASAVACYDDPGDSRCAWRGWDYFTSSVDHWLGLTGTDSYGKMCGTFTSGCSPDYVNDSCDRGGIKCQLIGARAMTDGQECNLIDACTSYGLLNITRTTKTYSREGRWDASQSQCVSCNYPARTQQERIMSTGQKCFDVADNTVLDVGDKAVCDLGSWSGLACRNVADNQKCESGCGAPSECDEKAVGYYWTGTDGKDYRCSDSCQKVLREPPLSEIISPDPNLWYSGKPNGYFEFRVYDEDRSGNNGVDMKCYYSVFDDYRKQWTVVNRERACVPNHVIDKVTVGNASSFNCSRQGPDQCWLWVKSCDKTGSCSEQNTSKIRNAQGRYGNYLKYNIDFTEPEIKQ